MDLTFSLMLLPYYLSSHGEIEWSAQGYLHLLSSPFLYIVIDCDVIMTCETLFSLMSRPLRPIGWWSAWWYLKGFPIHFYFFRLSQANNNIFIYYIICHSLNIHSINIVVNAKTTQNSSPLMHWITARTALYSLLLPVGK